MRACPPPWLHLLTIPRGWAPPTHASALRPSLSAHRLGAHTHPPTFGHRPLMPKPLAVPATFHYIVPRTRLCTCACRRHVSHLPSLRPRARRPFASLLAYAGFTPLMALLILSSSTSKHSTSIGQLISEPAHLPRMHAPALSLHVLVHLIRTHRTQQQSRPPASFPSWPISRPTQPLSSPSR